MAYARGIAVARVQLRRAGAQRCKFAIQLAQLGDLGLDLDVAVVDQVPGDEAYTPLRAVNLVTRQDEGAAEVLRSAEDVAAAIDDGRLTVEAGAVVNMPFLTWPGGER